MLGFVWVLASMLLGGLIAFFGYKGWARRHQDAAAQTAEKILSQAKLQAEQVVLDAQKTSAHVLDEARKEEQIRREELRAKEQRVEQRETMFDKRLGELDEQQKGIEQEKERLRGIKARLETMDTERQEKLQEIAGLTREQALEKLLADVQTSEQEALDSRLRKLEQVGEDELTRKAHKMLSLTIERLASSVAVETTTSIVELPTDEMKGRIIGKEGRNIKAIELLTGTEIVVDDTPQAVTVSSFSPVRRQVAKRAMETLMKDGRIQPARIEEAVEQAKRELAMEMKKAGESALTELAIPVSSIDPKLVQILGRLKFRTSYGQNQLQHAMEVAQLAAMLAEELRADVALCRKGGLFHDIGKAVDHDMQGSHPEIGYNIMKKFGFPEEIAYQSIGHHVDKPKTLEAVIIKAADAISGARPGARKNSLEQYVQRLEELEKTATDFPGVERCYALQAGREIRVFVRPTEVDDFAMYSLAKGIAQKIESDLQYPGEIKVTMIREQRVIEYAR